MKRVIVSLSLELIMIMHPISLPDSGVEQTEYSSSLHRPISAKTLSN